ncbi:MAG: hypothetical protein Q9188_000389 [Gyalolechia gomerana]
MPSIHAQMGWVKDQLSGNMLAEKGENFIGSINKSLHIDNFSSGFVESTSPGTKTVSLEKWVRYRLVHSASKALFDESMMKVDPQFVFYYFAFEEAAWKMLYRYPEFLAQDLYGAAKFILRSMSRFYEFERPDTVWMFKTMETEMRNLGLPSGDIATMTFMLLVGQQQQRAHNLLLGHRPHPHFPYRTPLHPQANGPRCARRWLSRPSGMKSSASTPRPPSSAFRPPTVEGLTINTGDQVLSPFRQLHLNRENFGPDAATWNPDRFVKTKELRRSMGYNPVGGSATHCPGRILAKQEVYTFVAVVLHRFEVELVEPKLPTVNVREPCLGAMRPIGDISVKIREK